MAWPVESTVTVIGWGGTCDIRLGAPGLAKIHCALVRDRGALYFRDLSGKGVGVNGRSMREGALAHDDLLSLGGMSFGVRIPTPIPAGTPTPTGSIVLDRMGESVGRPIDLTGTVTVVGGDPDCELVLDDDEVGPRQCLFARTSAGIMLRDLEPGSGVSVNGDQAAIHLLENDDEIGIGSSTFRLQLGADGVRASGVRGEIIVVDGDPAVRDLLGRMLLSAGYDVRVAGTARELLDRMIEDRAELVLLASILPDADATRLCRTIRRGPHWSGTAVILAASHAASDVDFDAGFDAGACDFLVQPFIRSEVLARVARRLRESRESRKFQELASVDALTGLLNRRTMERRLREAIAQAGRQRFPVGAIMADLDRFKRCNDEFGHDAGDRVLRSFARILRQNCREEDIAARYGGEEFCIISPHTPLSQAYSLADRLRRRWARIVFRFGERSARFTASFGVACYSPLHGNGNDSDTPRGLIKQADLALYAAKHQGRNRVVSADDIPPNVEESATA